jgi:hypothetical protein
MKILRRGKKSSTRFRVIKNNFFLAGGHQPEIGEVIEFIGGDNLSIAHGLCQRGCLSPEDLPEIGTYIVISGFFLPGSIEKFQAAPGDLVELKGVDALPLMLRRYVVPKDKTQWSPFRIKEERKMRDIMDAAQYSDGKAKIDANWKVSK